MQLRSAFASVLYTTLVLLLCVVAVESRELEECKPTLWERVSSAWTTKDDLDDTFRRLLVNHEISKKDCRCGCAEQLRRARLEYERYYAGSSSNTMAQALNNMTDVASGLRELLGQKEPGMVDMMYCQTEAKFRRVAEWLIRTLVHAVTNSMGYAAFVIIEIPVNAYATIWLRKQNFAASLCGHAFLWCVLDYISFGTLLFCVIAIASKTNFELYRELLIWALDRGAASSGTQSSPSPSHPSIRHDGGSVLLLLFDFFGKNAASACFKCCHKRKEETPLTQNETEICTTEVEDRGTAAPSSSVSGPIQATAPAQEAQHLGPSVVLGAEEAAQGGPKRRGTGLSDRILRKQKAYNAEL